MARLFALAGFLVAASVAAAQDWSVWELENSVAQYSDWLVIRQPGEGLCYIKQSYDRTPSKMELTMDANGAPVLITPFFRGIEGPITYWVDGSSPRTARAEDPKGTTVRLSRDVVSEMRAGHTLTVRAKPRGEAEREQRFGLSGFTAASGWLQREECGFKGSGAATGQGGGVALDVSLERDSAGRLVVIGTTSLPDGMSLMIDVVNRQSNYFGQDKVEVRGGGFRSDPFSNRGARLPAGTYELGVSSPMPSLQPASVKRAIGSKGEKLSGPAVKQGIGDYKVIDWTVRRTAP